MTPETLTSLEAITTMLLAASPRSASEAAAFEGKRDRELITNAELVRPCVEDHVILVTGGTGCIGSALLSQLEALGPKRLVSVSRGITHRLGGLGSVDYVCCDITREAELRRVFEDFKPDTVFHLAAQRDPGLAERTVHASLDTNVFGTRNLLACSRATGVRRFIYGSTGKALRPFTPDIYAASKKLGECLCLAATSDNAIRISVGRFTHVVDNSLVLRRFRAVRSGEALRLHDPHIRFYTQSAREAAQLLLIANATNTGGAVDVLAIRDLGIPTELFDLALSVAAESSRPRAIYVAGYEAGYEDSIYPGLYDPQTASDVSPLLNAFEGGIRARRGRGVDASPIRFPDCEAGVAALASLESALTVQC